MMTRTGRTWTFRDGVLLLLLLAGAVAVCFGIWRDIFTTGWRSAEQSHILMALPVAAFLVWVRRRRLRLAAPQWSMWGAAVFALGWVSSAVGFRTAVDLAWHAGAILMALGAVLTVLGPGVLRHFIPAVMVLAFLLPVPGRLRQEIAIPLQEISAWVTEVVLELAAFPITRTGNILEINGHAVAVAEACNGMRMVTALALITFAFVCSVPMRPTIRLVLLAISPLIALVVNIIRLVPTTVMYGYTDTSTADLFHDVSGWAVLVVAVIILTGVLNLLRWLEIPISRVAVRD